MTEADLSKAELSKANLWEVALCEATIDGARVNPSDIGGLPDACILAALTEEEWNMIQEGWAK